MVLAIGMFILGMILAIGCIFIGSNLARTTHYEGANRTLEIGQHFVEKYVKKLTPEDLTKINSASKEVIPEENLRVLDIDEEKYRKVMGWNEDRDTSGYDRPQY